MAGPGRDEAKTRRLLELYLFLSNVPRPAGRERVRANVHGYQGLDDAGFDRQFERDKSDLRALGVEVEVLSDPGSEVPSRYRLAPGRGVLGPLSLTAAETAVLQVARGVWGQTGLLAESSGALRKLVHEDVLLEDTPMAGLAPRSTRPDPSFEPLRDALRSRRAVRFPYRKKGAAASVVRHVQPWQLLLRHGVTYLHGFDLDRGEERVFRLGRITGAVRKTSDRAPYEIPDLAGRADPLARAEGGRDPVTVRLALAPGRAQALRSEADPLGPCRRDGLEGWDEVSLAVDSLPFAAQDLASFGADVVVLEPSELVALVVAQLREVAAGVPR